MNFRQTASGLLRRHRGLAALARRMRPLGAPGHDPERSRARAALRESLEQGFQTYLAQGGRMDFTPAATAHISVLIVLYNQAPLTFGCLQALMASGRQDLQVIIVDNASSDQTGALLDSIDGAVILRNTENLHFLRAVNQGAEKAIGPFLLLLNNDAFVAPDALDQAAVSLLHRRESASRNAMPSFHQTNDQLG